MSAAFIGAGTVLYLHLLTSTRSFSGVRSVRSHQQHASTDDDNDSITAQFGDFQDEANRGPVEPEVTARSLSTIDANIIRPQDLPDAAGLDSDAPSNNDHNYTLSPGLNPFSSFVLLTLSFR